jgi:hypothetical protein
MEAGGEKAAQAFLAGALDYASFGYQKRKNVIIMKHSDFKIGTHFQTNTGQVWQCTDIGTRTIAAIEIYAPDIEIEGFQAVRRRKLPAVWFKGPPYALEEHLFNEADIAAAYIDQDEGLRETLSRHDRSAHPGYPQGIVFRMFRKKSMELRDRYPRGPLLSHDRVTSDGRILHPYGVEALDSNGQRKKRVKKAERYSVNWVIRVFDIFSHDKAKMTEDEFVQLRIATEKDLRKAKRAQQLDIV